MLLESSHENVLEQKLIECAEWLDILDVLKEKTLSKTLIDTIDEGDVEKVEKVEKKESKVEDTKIWYLSLYLECSVWEYSGRHHSPYVEEGCSQANQHSYPVTLNVSHVNIVDAPLHFWRSPVCYHHGCVDTAYCHIGMPFHPTATPISRYLYHSLFQSLVQSICLVLVDLPSHFDSFSNQLLIKLHPLLLIDLESQDGSRHAYEE